MKYPKHPKKNEILGICAPSAGVGHKLEEYEKSIQVLQREGYQILETEHVRTDGLRSASALQRAKELHQLFQNPEVSTILCATGGDFMAEILPEIDWHILKTNPKWLWGYSDPTHLLFPYTIKYDVATIYGMNGGSFDDGKSFRFVQNALAILRGEKITQNSYFYIDSREPFSDEPLQLKKKSSWQATLPQLHVKGRCVGGCIDVLKDLIGTPYASITSFIKKYEKDGIIWFFDNFSLSAENLYRTLLQMKSAGWFRNTKAILYGRTLFESSETGMTYPEVLTKALPDIPIIYQADIGHTKPRMTMICGAMMNLEYKNHKASITFQYR